MYNKKRILVTGGSGLVGSSLKELSCSIQDKDFIFVSSKDYDLRDRDHAHEMFQVVKTITIE